MGAYKQFLASDIIITPFEVSKGFSFKGNELTGSNVSIDRFLGLNTSSLFNPNTDPTTGFISTQYQRLIYDSIKELYYSNYLTNPSGSPANTASFNTDGTITGPAYTTNYYNYLSTTLPTYRYFPTESNAVIGVISIPSNLFGEYLNPTTVTLTSSSLILQDDGLGNIISGSTNVGNIIYEHGVIILTSGSFINDFISTTNLTCSFQSTTTIYETQYKCTIRQNEFNFSQNPTVLGPPDQGYDINYYDDVLIYEDDAIYDGYEYPTNTLYPWATGSYFP